MAGLDFDATCSLVALDAEDRPVSFSPAGRDAQNVIVWMDHPRDAVRWYVSSPDSKPICLKKTEVCHILNLLK